MDAAGAQGAAERWARVGGPCHFLPAPRPGGLGPRSQHRGREDWVRAVSTAAGDWPTSSDPDCVFPATALLEMAAPSVRRPHTVCPSCGSQTAALRLPISLLPVLPRRTLALPPARAPQALYQAVPVCAYAQVPRAPGQETARSALSLRVLAEVADVLEPTGLQEEAELPARILAEFVSNSRKKDKLLCSQLQVVGFLQSFLAQEDAAQALGPLASEDTSRQQALAAKEQWKELKSAYQEHVEALRCCLPQALPQLEEALDKCAELWEALQQLQAKKQVEEEKAREAQKQWRLQQETRLHSLAKASAEIRERQTGVQQKLAGLEQEIEALRQCAGREQGRLHRNQAYLKLLCALQGKPLAPEALAEVPEDRAEHGATVGPALPPGRP